MTKPKQKMDYVTKNVNQKLNALIFLSSTKILKHSLCLAIVESKAPYTKRCVNFFPFK